MSDFVVSARKYRPVTFNSVVGQQHVTNTLKNAMRTGHLAQAFLFTGPRGVGKTTCARILAKVLNCQSPTNDNEPCDTCSSCVAFRDNASMNIHELDAASNNGVEHIRTLIEQVRFAPQSGKYKIYIIDEVHMLSTGAFNAFLKTLEEPPKYAIFILATTEKHKILPTILSRCQIFDFRRITVADMTAHLTHIAHEEGVEAEEEALDIISQKADGGLRDALSIFDRMVSFSGQKVTYASVVENLNILDFDYYFRMTDAMLMEDIPAVINVFDEILRKGFDAELFLSGLMEHLRNLLVCKDKSTIKLLEVSGSIRKKYESQAEQAPTALLLSVLALANDCDVNYKMARNKRVHVEIALMRACHVMRAVTAHPAAPSAEVVSDPAAKYQKADLKITGETKYETTLPVTKKLTSIAAMMAEVETEIKAQADAPSIVLDDETLNGLWKKFGPRIDSPLVKTSFDLCELKALDNTKVQISVPKGNSKNNIQVILAQCLAFFREELNHPTLTFEFWIDENKVLIEEKEIEKPMGPKEIYQELLKFNPALSELQKTFDLRLDV